MKKIALFFILICSWSINGIAQNLQLNIFNCQGEDLIAYCTVFNSSKNIFAVSDDKGLVNITADNGDSLYISHVAYKDTFLIKDKQNMIFCMQPIDLKLNEIVITDKKKNFTK